MAPASARLGPGSGSSKSESDFVIMRLILFRHGPAGTADAARWPDDRERPLSSRGAERTQAAALGLGEMESEITRVLTSPLRRALETGAIVREALEIDRALELHADLSPGGSARRLLESFADGADDETVVLVGHEPDLGKLAGTLLFGAPAHLPLKKAGACAIEFEGSPIAGEGQLLWFLPPRALRRLARKQRAHA
jgi:phosphohistidine phosphatase